MLAILLNPAMVSITAVKLHQCRAWKAASTLRGGACFAFLTNPKPLNPRGSLAVVSRGPLEVFLGPGGLVLVALLCLLEGSLNPKP